MCIQQCIYKLFGIHYKPIVQIAFTWLKLFVQHVVQIAVSAYINVCNSSYLYSRMYAGLAMCTTMYE